MIVCECTGTTDAAIRALAKEGVTRVAEVTRRCGAGGCCRSCRPAIAAILRQAAPLPAASDAQREEPLAVAGEAGTI